MAGIGLAQMNSLLNSQSTLNSVKELNSNRNMIQGQMGVLNSEIQSDKGRGINTEYKEGKYASMESTADSIMERLAETADGLNDRIAEENEKIREEEAAKAENADNAIANGTFVEPVDTADISMFAQHVAADAPPAVPEIPAVQTAQAGEVIDVKV